MAMLGCTTKLGSGLPNIFHYLDYRHYLEHFLAAKKLLHPNYSYRVFCAKAGLSSRSFLSMVLQKKRDISLKSLDGFCWAFEFKKKERKYFETLVKFNQTLKPALKKNYYEELLSQLSKHRGTELRTGQYAFLSTWYAPVILEIIGLEGFNDDPNWICQKLNHLITPKQAKDTLGLLGRLGLVSLTNDGHYVLTQKYFDTPDEVAEVAAYDFHNNMLAKAQESLARHEMRERQITGITSAMSQAQFEQVQEIIRECEDRIVQELEKSQEKGERVYQIQFQLFPLTRGSTTPRNDRVEEIL